MYLIWCTEAIQRTSSFRTAARPHQRNQQRNGAHSIDDTPHTDAPTPIRMLENGFADIAANPRVDL
jgi:hypothetical protein